MPFILSDDSCEIYYEVTGSGPAIALISGFMGITEIWRAQVDLLAEKFQCITFDTRGAGRSDKPIPNGPYGVDRHAQDLAIVLDAVGVDKVLLIGHSMGGNIACEYFQSNSERVCGIVFIGSYVSGKQIDGVGNTLDRVTSAVTKKSERIDFYRNVGLPDHIAIEATKWPLYALLGNAKSFMTFDGSEGLKKISVPCLVVHGSEDVVSPYDPCAIGLIKALPNVESLLLDGVNHCPMVERPDLTNARITQYIDQQIAW
ncbi:MAG: 3-oxoadipate enol-lactonase [Gammaproteobacteria bacterium]|jgi:3-oxoadipate enol-lactonase